MLKEICKCRICQNTELQPVLNLGVQHLTGIFPRARSEKTSSGPLELVKCSEDFGGCGLLQLRHSYDFSELYGHNYGYRSGLNSSMVRHLDNKVRRIMNIVEPRKGDIVLDIGSNDGTLLKAYGNKDITAVGCDPTADKFRGYYSDNAVVLCDFFSSELFKKHFPGKRAKIISSIAMFYDLESPLDFMLQVREILADDGIWVFEQSYMPAMLNMNSYDTVCHEHLEYYRMKQIKMMTDKAGLKIIDVEINDANGGSFAITVAKARSPYREAVGTVSKILHDEKLAGLGELKPYTEFRERVFRHRQLLPEVVNKIRKSHGVVLGYGASTKGNVILQFCGLTESDIPFIAEVNTDKFGAYTPGTLIPIISEQQAKGMGPKCFMVLPWHFRDNILSKERAYIDSGGCLLFPLPEPEVVRK